MKTILLFILVFMQSAYAGEYSGISQNITTDFQGKKLNGLLASGMYYQVEKGCAIPDYYPVIIQDTGSYCGSSYSFSGGSNSKVWWEDVKFYVNNCPETDCNTIAEHEEKNWMSCEVCGIIGGTQVKPSCEDIRPVYLKDTGNYYIFDTRLFEGFTDSGETVDEVILELNSEQCFDINSVSNYPPQVLP
ncbi:unnamed protein product [marine sediment metagenome]|uniref:Uncharacterized protein n=1 Tax=marine sediment metagenome TaxID=412755 RepID=X0RQG0_9ZZZZ